MEGNAEGETGWQNGVQQRMQGVWRALGGLSKNLLTGHSRSKLGLLTSGKKGEKKGG